MKVLIVVDMQNDFIDGSLGTLEAVRIVPHVVEKIRAWEGPVYATQLKALKMCQIAIYNE